MKLRSLRTPVFALALGTVAMGCKKREIPGELVGSYARSADLPPHLRAELSIARGGMVLTVVRLEGSVDMGAFSTLFTDPNAHGATTSASASASAGLGRSVVAARTFSSLKCDATSCAFELTAEKKQEPCSGTFEKIQNTVVVVAGGACQFYSGRWELLESLPATSATAAPTAAPSAPVAATDAGTPAPVSDAGPAPKLDFPPDIPAPHDHMSCLSACSIMDTRCHRASNAPDRDAFLRCVETHEICRARCEQVFPFFSH